MLCRNHIYLQLAYYSYNKALAKVTVYLYYASLAELDKKRLYNEFQQPNLKIYIIVSSNTLAYSIDIADINRLVQYSILSDKSINILQQ